MKQFFLYVGHSNFGKSFALKEITNGKSRQKTLLINGKAFMVRKMSNDDDEKSLLKFVEKIKNSNYSHYIIAFCPKQEYSEKAKEILEVLKQSGNLFFFVQKNSFKDDREIEDAEINSLKGYGTVEVMEGKKEAAIRAVTFRKFIDVNFK